MHIVFDIETDGLLEEVTLIRCLHYRVLDPSKNLDEVYSGTILDRENLLTLFREYPDSYYVGHNIICYDIPVIKKIWGVVIPLKNCIDTLGLSYTIYPNIRKHGLESWGEYFKVPKPVIKDWKNLSLQEYIYRCSEDTKINTRLWKKTWSYLHILYNYETPNVLRYIDYINFKMDCLREHEEVKYKIDLPLIEKSLAELSVLKEEKEAILINNMPRNITYKMVKKPKSLYKKDGVTFSVLGKKWLDLCRRTGARLEEDFITIEDKNTPGNPSSSTQIKNWLFALGWIPETFEERKNTAGEMKEVPQIYLDSEVCPSIKKLYEIEPALKELDSLSLINHRIGVFKSFLENSEDGFAKCSAAGFTNTLRLKHRKPTANMPSIDKFYGKKIRGAIIKSGEDKILCGTDMSALEDTTKQHYMYYFDKEYVMQMRVPGFDPHLDIAILAGMLTEQEVSIFKSLKNRKESGEVLTDEEINIFKRINGIRSDAKTVNFAGVYGAGAPKIAKTLGRPLEFAQTLHKTYWNRNKSVKQVASSMKIKIIFKDLSQANYIVKDLERMHREEQEKLLSKAEQLWVQNPISKFWYSLRYLKDVFSTINQGKPLP